MTHSDSHFTALGYSLDADKSRLDLDVIHGFLTHSTWAKGISRERVKLSIDNSLCLGLYHHEQQIGFARLVTDAATFAYLCDVFVDPAYQGKGLGRWLSEGMLARPEACGLRRIMLATTTAPWLYEKMGFEPVNQPNYIWHQFRPDIYQT
ncbi:GNAT family N-acetyltransferase [Ectopseudomonas mendocina]|uniref:GNAT family N-acetyltransferase n=1 Tax=Ectopseudomonas mendocina TaxID=300 RepID=A0ABZ2RI98_ECTME